MVIDEVRGSLRLKATGFTGQRYIAVLGLGSHQGRAFCLVPVCWMAGMAWRATEAVSLILMAVLNVLEASKYS